MKAVHIAIVLIVVIILVFYWRNSAIVEPRLIDKSNGTFDAPARETLAKIKTKKTKTAQDHIDAADIVLHNILEDDLHAAGPERVTIALDIANEYVIGLDMMNENDPAAVDVTQRMRAMAANNANMPDVDLDLQRVLELTMRTANVAENARADTRMMVARKKARGRGNAATTYLKDSVHYENDRQNVHDSQVNTDLRATFRIIQDPTIMPQDSIDELRQYIKKCTALNAVEKSHAETALQKMAEGGAVTALGTSEDYIVASVWNRAEHPENVNNKENLRESLVTSLAQCYEGAGLVCANGRAGRVIGSLAGIDFNEEAGNVGSFQMFKNEIIKASNDAMNSEIKKIEAENPAAIKSWNSGDNVPDVENRLKRVITECCDKYAGRLSASSLKVIKDICIKAVE